MEYRYFISMITTMISSSIFFYSNLGSCPQTVIMRNNKIIKLLLTYIHYCYMKLWYYKTAICALYLYPMLYNITDVLHMISVSLTIIWRKCMDCYLLQRYWYSPSPSPALLCPALPCHALPCLALPSLSKVLTYFLLNIKYCHFPFPLSIPMRYYPSLPLRSRIIIPPSPLVHLSDHAVLPPPPSVHL